MTPEGGGLSSGRKAIQYVTEGLLLQAPIPDSESLSVEPGYGPVGRNRSSLLSSPHFPAETTEALHVNGGVYKGNIASVGV